jgi:hypothetical protein
LNTGTYDYVAVYVDDLLIVAQDPASITKAFGDHHLFKLKCNGTLKFHFGCDFVTDKTGTLCIGPKKNIDKMTMQY